MPSLPELMPTEVSDETFGGVTYHVAGELVPVLSVDVTNIPVYFEHHILLWKNTTITIGLKSLKGALKRMIAGMQIFVTEASGPGVIAFSRDGPGHSVPIHLRRGEEIQLGVIYDPFTNEIWTTVRGGPTRLNGKIVRASTRSRLADAVIAMGFSKNRENMDRSLPHLNRLARRVKKIRVMGSAALELAYVASGRLDAYIERTINLWDVAAGQLLVENAGGEFYALPAPAGKMRMCADNGRLRKKLNIGGLLK